MGVKIYRNGCGFGMKFWVPYFSQFSIGVCYTINMNKMTRDEIVNLIQEMWSASNNTSRWHEGTLKSDPDNVTVERMLSRSSARSAALHDLMMEIRGVEGA